MTRKRNSVFRESKDKFVNRKRSANIRKLMHEDPLLAAKKENTIGKVHC